MNDINQNPEQIARDKIDAMLRAAGWEVQDKGKSLATSITWKPGCRASARC